VGLAVGGLVAVLDERASRAIAGGLLLVAAVVGSVAEVPVLSVLAGDSGIWIGSSVLLVTALRVDR